MNLRKLSVSQVTVNTVTELKIGTWLDFEDIESMLHKFISMTPYENITVDHDKVRAMISDFLGDNGTTKIIVLAVENDKTIGMIVGATSEPLFSTEKMACEMAWWVDPDHRNSRVGFKLIEAYEYWANKVGCKFVQLCSMEDDYGKRLDKFYTRRGFKLYESAYLKEVA